MSSSPLLDLPGELRDGIYRLAVTEAQQVDITSAGLREPGLLLVSEQIRAESGPIFYAENTFRVPAKDYSSTLLLRSSHLLKMRGTEHRVGIRGGPDLGRTRTPNWANLILWLQRYHAKVLDCNISPPSKQHAGSAVDVKVVGAMFEAVTAMQGLSWKRVAKVMDEHRHVLIALDAAWAN